jgi:AcrR family transcriptional regulator
MNADRKPAQAPAAAEPVPRPLTSRGRRTRAALVQAGREVFEEVGFAEARIDDVADRAGVSHGTFYTYFDSKGALFHEVAGAVIGEMFTATRVGHSVPDDPYARIEATNRAYLRAWARNARLLHVLDQLATGNEEFRQLLLELREVFITRITGSLRRLQDSGQADKDLPPRLTAVALSAMVQYFAHIWLDLGEDVDEEGAVDTLTRLWANAIGLTTPRR